MGYSTIPTFTSPWDSQIPGKETSEELVTFYWELIRATAIAHSAFSFLYFDFFSAGLCPKMDFNRLIDGWLDRNT